MRDNQFALDVRLLATPLTAESARTPRHHPGDEGRLTPGTSRHFRHVTKLVLLFESGADLGVRDEGPQIVLVQAGRCDDWHRQVDNQGVTHRCTWRRTHRTRRRPHSRCLRSDPRRTCEGSQPLQHRDDRSSPARERQAIVPGDQPCWAGCRYRRQFRPRIVRRTLRPGRPSRRHRQPAAVRSRWRSTRCSNMRSTLISRPPVPWLRVHQP